MSPQYPRAFLKFSFLICSGPVHLAHNYLTLCPMHPVFSILPPLPHPTAPYAVSFHPQPPQTSLHRLPLPLGSNPPPVTLIFKNPHSVHTSDLVLYHSLSHWKLQICILSHPPKHIWGHPSILLYF